MADIMRIITNVVACVANVELIMVIILQAQVIQKVHNAIQWINHFPVKKAI